MGRSRRSLPLAGLTSILQQHPDVFELTAQLVDIRSESHHEGEITDWIERRLTANAPGLELTRLGHNLVARTNRQCSFRLVIAGHTDTVPINDNVPSRRDADVLWGCGTSDMKSGLAVMIALAENVVEPVIDVTYVFYEAEEVAEQFNGLKTLFAQRPDLMAADVALLGEPTNAAIEAGCQGTMRLRLVLRGARAHTARPWMGRNAIHRMGSVLQRLAAYDDRRPVIDSCEYREALQAVQISGGVAGNVVPDEATLMINHRFAPDRTSEQAFDHVRQLLDGLIDDADTFELVDVAGGALPSLGHPVLASLIRRNRLPIGAKLGWTDVARFAAHGVPAANYGPGDATLAHTRDERVHRGPIEASYAALVDLLTVGVD
jgi:succinyl-diaminopimelate desuccinylase